jgi:hypothetical protein
VDQELPVSCGPSADQHYYAMGPIRLDDCFRFGLRVLGRDK